MQQDTISSWLSRSASNAKGALSGWEPLAAISARRWALGVIVALVSFAALGTVTALWQNPFFVRMTPAGGWEITLLALMSGLGGFYMALRRSECGTRTATVGGVLGFLGIACPVCNKILLLLFGGELLLTYFEPVRIYIAAGGSLLLASVVFLEYRRQRMSSAASGNSMGRTEEAQL
jgi:hypothetical protein